MAFKRFAGSVGGKGTAMLQAFTPLQIFNDKAQGARTQTIYRSGRGCPNTARHKLFLSICDKKSQPLPKKG
ncbi:hypothetical protein CEK71_09560 [Methylovulum psychrotolerans]|jgi:hypothetical protein|uniref:Uncharacterized protein n=1 Tax=Methylovulum psychrotolerans TaxID=1704499 RepID=A0A1Z4BYI3_9GAMM|nr:hypothetical protein CEK71_09560 [Methylovulum psychrotolerans]